MSRGIWILFPVCLLVSSSQFALNQAKPKEAPAQSVSAQATVKKAPARGAKSDSGVGGIFVGSYSLSGASNSHNTAKFEFDRSKNAAIVGSPSQIAPTQLCDILFPTPRTIDAAALINLIGDTAPFQLKAAGGKTILIYESSEKPGRLTINDIKDKLKQLEDAAPVDAVESPPFSVEIAIRHASALGDLAARFSPINPNTFTVTNVGLDTIRVSSKSQPDCDTWRAFLRDVRHVIFAITPEPPSMRLYYLSASDVSTAFAAATTTAKTTADANKGSGTKGQDDSGANTEQGGRDAPSGEAGDGTKDSEAASGKGNSTTKVTIGAGITTITTNVAGTTDGGSKNKPLAAKRGNNSQSGAKETAAPTGAKPPLTIVPLESDILLFANANAGDDSAVKEKMRILALLDLPRPEMLINAWVMQNSTGDAGTAGQFTSLVREIVNQHNDYLQRTVLQGYAYIRNQIGAQPRNYFEQSFYEYVTQRYIASSPYGMGGTATMSSRAEEYVAGRIRLQNDGKALDSERGICAPNVYCLGYSTLFQPMKPRLTDLLLAIIGSKNPADTALGAITAAERSLAPSGRPLPPHKCSKGNFAREANCKKMFSFVDLGKVADEDSDLTSDQQTDVTKNIDSLSCDRRDIYREIEIGGDSYASQVYPNVQLECFREQAELLLRPKPGDTQPSGVGLLRAAIASFLFNYKMSQQFPHEFAAYDLSISADTLNTALSPLVDAFNRDIAAYQVYLRAILENEVTRINNGTGRSTFERIFKLDQPGFTNNGLVTVRTISGQEAKVNTVSQSYLDASTAPQLSQVASDVLASLTGTSSAGTSKPGGATSAAKAANNIFTPQSERIAEASLALLKNYQSSEAQIGRAIKLDVTPRSLAGASAAEINVSFNVDDSANPTYYGSGPQSGKPVDISRVATHDTTTHVRVDSVKLFEISSITAVLQRPRPRFPLLPPFVEIPYIGTVAGVPLPAAKEYHNSTAVLSAVVVPTAADLAYGLEFVSDKIVDPDLDYQKCRWPWDEIADPKLPPCTVRTAESVRDLDDLPIREFNRAMVRCIATEGWQAYSSLNPISQEQCKDLKLTNVLTDAH